jgi:hypothetical protein
MDNTTTTTNQQPNTTQVALPNASIVLVLGIVSIVLCWCHGIIGLVLAIVALVMANKDMALYAANPQNYTESSYKNLKTGRTVAIVGLVLAGVFLFMMIIGLLFLGLNFALFPWEMVDSY